MSSTAPEPSVLATRQGKLTLALLCGVAFLDFVDASIVNVALPSIRGDLGFSVQRLQWVLSAYLLTYGGFMLLGGRMADLLGRRRILMATPRPAPAPRTCPPPSPLRSPRRSARSSSCAPGLAR